MDKQYNRNRSTTMNQKQDIKSLKLDRSSLKIKENEFAEYKNEIYKISSIIDFTYVIGINIETKRPKRLKIQKLYQPQLNNNKIGSRFAIIDLWQ